MNIINKLKMRLVNIGDNYRQMKNLPRRIEELQKAIGRIELYLRLDEENNDLCRQEFKVFSQHGDDGIIQYILHRIPIENKVFVEFGVEDYTEANTRFLLQNDNWSGLVIDGSSKNVERIKRDRIYWRHNLKVECAFVSTENINDLLLRNGIEGDIGLLSIDIDGNDYWVWQAIQVIQPRIVICEYNSTFGPYKKVTTPYDEKFVRTQAHFSNLYYGASIAALEYLAQKKGYSLIGSNQAGNNLFFVRSDLSASLPILPAEKAYIKAQFRESRDSDGNSTYLDFEQRVNQILEMPLFDLDREQLITIRDLGLT